MNRNELQDAAVRRLEKSKRLICQWATGVGKTMVLLKFLMRHPEFNCLVLVPEKDNIQNWEDEFDKFDAWGTGTTLIMCYASLHKLKNTNWDVICFDEVPHIDTELRINVCNTVTADYILALGAIIDEDERNSLESVYGKFDKSVVGLEQAIRMGILPVPTIKVMHLQMDDTERKYFCNGRRYTAKERYDHIQRKVENAVNNYNAASNKWNQQQMFRAGNERKRFLGLLKEDAARRICDALCLKKKRFICFCSSIDQANKLGGDHAFTSETPVSKKLLDRFNNHEIDSLYVVGKLIEAQNLNGIEAGIICQLGGTERITVQSIGRVMRSLNPIVYVPVFDGTKDDDFLYTLTANIPKEYIKHYKF